MVKALGIDPGTGSFDLVVVEGGHVVAERSVSTFEVAKKPEVLVKVVKELGGVDLIAGPSGYGVPLTFNSDIVEPRIFALEVLLLTREEDLELGIKSGEVGMAVYDALAKVVEEFWRKGLKVCYIPSVILLPTVPDFRKINKLDMGTADKMAVAVLGVIDQSRELGLNYKETSFILVEVGFGYNAVIGVKEGLIVDGLGGSLVQTGFLTVGALDAEVAVLGRLWVRSDVFHGGVADICGTYDIDQVVRGYLSGEEPYTTAFKAFIDGILKAVAAVHTSIRKPKEVLLSGRYSRNKVIREILEEALSKYASVRRLKGLEGAKVSKEAAQGYAVVAEGVAGGEFSDLVKRMKIPEARGTVADWIRHPRLREMRERLRRTYSEVVRNPKL